MKKEINSELGLIITTGNKVKSEERDYINIVLSGYHGDKNYDVNKDIKIYLDTLNKNYALQKFISIGAYLNKLTWDDLRQEIKNIFDSDEDFMIEYEECQEEIFHDYSEVHDNTIELRIESIESYIDGVLYSGFSLNLTK